jgi:hypothetical protein
MKKRDIQREQVKSRTPLLPAGYKNNTITLSPRGERDELQGVKTPEEISDALWLKMEYSV